MKSQTAVAALAATLINGAAAFPQLAEKARLVRRQNPGTFQAPGGDDVRAPCPGLNTLANEGFINRNGRGISAQQVEQGFLDAFGFAFEVTTPGANNAVNLQNNGQGTFDLDTLNQPHQIEHDASLTRDDFQMAWSQNANNHDFNATIWGMSLDWYGPVTHIDVSSANTARLGRIQQAQQQDFPGWFVENDGGSLAEHGFTLTCMNDHSVGTDAAPQARLDWVDFWFRNQQRPTDLGWVKPSGISGDQFNAVVQSVQNAPTTSPQPRTTSATSSSPTVVSTSASVSASTTATASVTASTTGSVSITSSSATTFPTVSGPYQNSTTASVPGYSTTASGSVSASASVSGSVTKKPDTSSTPTVPAEVTSSATAVATQLAGPPPYVPCGYTQDVSAEQWKQVAAAVNGYVSYVQSIIFGLCGAHSVGSIPIPGAPASSGNGGAPWYGGMPDKGPSGPSGSSPAPGPLGPYIASGIGGAAPQNTCACK